MPTVECTIVELCIFKRTAGIPLFLVMKRSSSERLYPNMWQILTGTIHRAEKAMQAAVREMQEETGLVPDCLWVAPIVGSFFDPQSDSVEMCPLFAAEVASSVEPKLSSEHQQYEWASYERAEKLLVWPGHLDAIRIVHDFILGDREAGRLTEIKPAVAERKIA